MPRLYCTSSTAALSVVAHVSVAALVLWRGAMWFDSSGGGGRAGERTPVSWVVVPPVTSPPTKTVPTPPRVAGATGASPRIERVTLVVSPRVVAIAQPLAVPASLSDPLPSPVDVDEGTGGGLDKGPSCGAGSEVDTSPDGDAGSGSFGPSPSLAPTALAKTARDDERTHDVQFWIRADGRVTRIVVNPPIQDSEYRRRFMEAMNTFVFGPVKTPDGRPIDYAYNCVVYP